MAEQNLFFIMTNKAIVTQIDYAGLSFEGLMMPDGEYRIMLTQISTLFLKSRKLSLKQLKALTRLGLESHEKTATELTNQKSERGHVKCRSHPRKSWY